MHRVLAVATRVVCGDLFCIKKWDKTEKFDAWNPTEEKFFITVHNLTHAQVNSENMRRYIACMGDITSFSFHVRRVNGSYSITIRASIRFRQAIRFSIMAENELGFTNQLTFQFHHFPNNFCGFCSVIGHKLENCELFVLHQQQVEEQQAEADVAMAAIQEIDEQ